MMRIGMDHTWLGEVGVRIANIDALRLSRTVVPIVLHNDHIATPITSSPSSSSALVLPHCSIDDTKTPSLPFHHSVSEKKEINLKVFFGIYNPLHLQGKEAEMQQKKNDTEKQLEVAEVEAATVKNDLKLAMKRIEDLQTAITGELDSESYSDPGSDSSDEDIAVSTR